MDEDYKKQLLDIEENRWWNKARRDIIFRLLKNLNRDSKILEIGCSGGVLIRFLENKGFFDIWGIDISKTAIDLCKKRGITNVSVADGAGVNFNNEEFDIIIASDVLEHINDDSSALTEWNRIIKPNGKLVVFVPAFNFLWDEHDIKNHHCRRYSRSELIYVLRKANFKIERSSCWNFSLFFPASLMIIFQRIFLKRKISCGRRLCKLNPTINKFLTCLLKFENWLLTKFDFPAGVTIFALAEKRGNGKL